MGVSLGSAYGEISIDTSGVSKGIDAAKQSVSSFQRSMENIGRSMTRVGKALTVGVTLPLVAIGKQAVTTATDFESQMNVLGVAARNAGTGMDELREAALAVGGDTRLVGVSASEAADAMTNFYKAGMTTTDIFGDLNSYLEEGTELTGALRAAVDLAAASDLDLATASDAVAVAMATFGLEAEDATRISNSFVQAADASVAEVEDLVAALENVGPTAAAFGWSLEDVNIALALLSERGIRGAEAGTALKSMMTNLMRPTKDVQATLAALNVELYSADGTMRSLPEIIGSVARGMSTLTEEQRNQAVQTLAGTYGMKAMNTLLAEGVEGWDDMSEAVADAATAQEVAAARTEGLAAAWEQFTGVLETLLIEVGTPLIRDFLTPLVNKASEVLSSVQQQHPEWLKWGVVIGGVAAAAGPLLIGLGQMVTALGAVGGAVSTAVGGLAKLGPAIAGLASSIGVSTAALLGPVGLVAALGVAVVALKKMEEARQEEAASILASTKTYSDYIRQMEDAGLEAYAFSESLFEVAKAKQEADEAFDTSTMQDALAEFEELGRLALGQWNEGIPKFLAGASDMAVAIARDRDQMVLLAEQLGYSGDLLDDFVERLIKAAEAQRLLRLAEKASSVEMGDHEERMLGIGEAAERMAASVQRAGEKVATSYSDMAREAGQAAKAERELAEATAATAAAEAQFGETMDALHEAMSGTIGPDFEALAAGYANLREAIASGAEGIDEMTAAMQRQREAFVENTNAMIYNIAEKQIMQALEQGLIEDVNQSGTAYDEASGAAVRLAEKLGLVDQGTVLLTQAVMEEVQAFIAGDETAGSLAGKLDTLSTNMADAAKEGKSLDGAIRSARLSMEAGEKKAGSLGGAVGDLSGRLDSATGAAHGLAGGLNAIPRNVNVDINVRTHYTGGGAGPPAVVDPVTGEPVVVGGAEAYQRGGQFTVRGPGGVDRVPVFFRATAGEVVTVTPPGQVPPPDPRTTDRVYTQRMMQTLTALVEALGRQGGGSTSGPAGQYLNVYGGLHLAGVSDVDSLLGQLAGMST